MNPFSDLSYPVQERFEGVEFKKVCAPRRPTDLVRKLIARDGPNCCWCKRETSPDVNPRRGLRSTVEHIIPRSKGGSNHMYNLRVACRKCNNSHKGGQDLV